MGKMGLLLAAFLFGKLLSAAIVVTGEDSYSYSAENPLGSGVNGIVYRGIRLSDQRMFALKFSRFPANPFINKTLRHEVTIARQLAPLAIYPQPLQWCEDHKLLIKPWVEGPTLAQLLVAATLTNQQESALLDLFQRLFSTTLLVVDLSPDNLMYDTRAQHWMIVDASSVETIVERAELYSAWKEEIELRFLKNFLAKAKKERRTEDYEPLASRARALVASLFQSLSF